MRLRVLLAAAVVLLTASAAEPGMPSQSWVEVDLTPESIRGEIDASARQPIEGIWRATADGATIAILRRDAAKEGMRSGRDTYLLVIVASPMGHLRCGTAMGVATPTARPGRFDAWLYTRLKGLGLQKPKQFVLELADDSHLTFVPVKKGLKFNLSRLLPYMFRNVVRRQDTRPDNLDGCVRLYPPSNSSPLAPRYL